MAVRTVAARDILLQVLAADATTWLTIRGLNTVNINEGEDEEITDVTVYESQGNAEKRKMQIGASMSLEGFLLKDTTTGVQDPGQARVTVLHKSLGEASLGKIRFRHPMDTVWTHWDAVFSLSEQGGGNNDMRAWGASVAKSGASSEVAV